MVTVSVVVPAREEADSLAPTLDSLAAQRLPDGWTLEVIVVACGDDGTLEVARDHPAADRVLEDDVRTGAGPARNQGAAVARGDVLAFTDADTVVAPWWVRAHTSHYADPQVVGVGGPLRPLEGGLVDRLLFRVLSDLWYRVSWSVGFVQQSGNNCSVRREAFEAVAGFDESLAFLEDTDLSMRLRERGRVVYEPRVPVWTSVRRQHREGYGGLFLAYAVAYCSYALVGTVPDVGYFER
ncbi:glycosyltransferase family 2 protein [Natronobiforma cellulositropha]|uniref:glycosyltransferase n=1 Tax=Natronobiforma cellulositropha TaxID=1679076 RepID=UPI0021D5C928|nr:glycosyltransferase [Natronobiforma cellulositropha]